MYYRVMLDGEIIDALESLNCCKYSYRSRAVLRCGEKNCPEGIISQRTGRYYQVDGWPEFPETVSGSGGTVQLVEIDADTYAALLQALDSGEEYVPEVEIEQEPDVTLEFVVEQKVAQLNKDCEKVIEAGFTLQMSDGESYHFTMKNEDQIAMMSIMARVQTGETEFDFYASDRKCLTMTAEDATNLVTTATAFRSYHVAYFRCMAEWVESLSVIKEVATVAYGDVVPEGFRSPYLVKYATAMGVEAYAEAS